MGLDIRWPIGLMFSLIGIMLVVFGFVTGSDPKVYECSLKMNVNLYWGLLLVVFGGWMLIMAFRGSRKAGQTEQVKPGAQPAGRR